LTLSEEALVGDGVVRTRVDVLNVEVSVRNKGVCVRVAVLTIAVLVRGSKVLAGRDVFKSGVSMDGGVFRVCIAGEQLANKNKTTHPMSKGRIFIDISGS